MNTLNATDDGQAAMPAKPGRRWLKTVALAGGGTVLLAVLAVSGLWWWAGTDGSLATALRWAEQSLPLSAGRTTGSLRAGGHIERLVWQQDGLTVQADDVSLAWQPGALLQGMLKFERLAVASLQVDDQRAASVTPATPPHALGLPLRVALSAFSVGQLRLSGQEAFKAFEASGISGRYEFNGLQHQLDLTGADVASGRYSGRAVLSSRAPLMLDASLSGALTAPLPDSKTSVPLALSATARGPLTELLVNAALQMTARPAADKKPTQAQPQASASARITPWAAQPLPQADANFRDLDIAALWPGAPQTQLSGSASVRPQDNTAAAGHAWLLQLQLANRLPGPWDQQRLPLERLQANGEWRDGVGLVHALKAQLGGGELQASGEWRSATAQPQAWQLQATLQGLDPAMLHSQLAALPLDGRATVRSQGAAVGFDASVRATGTVVSQSPGALHLLQLREASATGSWNAQQAGGTLRLSALRVRSDEAELSGQLEAQPAAQGGKGRLSLTAPGLDAKLEGELRQSTGSGELSLHGRDAAQALRWLQKLPGMPAAVQTASASGSAELQASWQGGWRDPALQARLEIPSLDWRAAAVGAQASPPAAGSTKTTKTTTAPTPSALKVRALQATLSGRLSQAQLSLQGRLEADQRRYALQLAAEAGHASSARNTPLSESAWQGLLKQFSVAVEDPALGAGAWRFATRGAVPLKWTPTRAGGAFESGAGEALLSAPAAMDSSQATLAWQPVRWRPGELITAGKLTGLPMAWVELLAGPQMAGAGLAGKLLLDGEWDATLSDTLRLKASLARSSGDITVQAETAQGTSARVAAGVRQARVSLVSEGDALTLALRWDSERAGTADGRLLTRLARAPAGTGVGGWLWPADAPLNGQLRAQLPRIGVWSVLAPPGWRLRGSLGTDVAISGTRAAPQLAGELQANDLALRSVVDGIEFGNGRLRARLDGTRLRINEFSLQGAGDKGTGGTLTAQGEAGWVEGRAQVNLNAKLERLRASIRT
ncbi:MAG TPA: DUF490 domain-containing protein, partial [Polaromonas sp.]